MLGSRTCVPMTSLMSWSRTLSCRLTARTYMFVRFVWQGHCWSITLFFLVLIVSVQMVLKQKALKWRMSTTQRSTVQIQADVHVVLQARDCYVKSVEERSPFHFNTIYRLEHRFCRRRDRVSRRLQDVVHLHLLSFRMSKCQGHKKDHFDQEVLFQGGAFISLRPQHKPVDIFPRRLVMSMTYLSDSAFHSTPRSTLANQLTVIDRDATK